MTREDIDNELKYLRELAHSTGSFDDASISDSIRVGITSTLILDENKWRRYALLVNDSDAIVYLSLSPVASLNAGIRLNAEGGSYEICPPMNLYLGQVHGIAGEAVKNITITEVSYAH